MTWKINCLEKYYILDLCKAISWLADYMGWVTIAGNLDRCLNGYYSYIKHYPEKIKGCIRIQLSRRVTLVTLFERTIEHNRDEDSAVFRHLNTCSNFQHIKGLFNLLPLSPSEQQCPINPNELHLETVRDNISITDSDSHWYLLSLKRGIPHQSQHAERNLTPA